MSLTIAEFNQAQHDDALAMIAAVYEHSPWVAEGVVDQRPVNSVAHLKHLLARAVRAASENRQLSLLRAHPQLAGKAAAAGTLTDESTSEQHRAGLDACSPQEFERLHQLNADYQKKFSWPFIVAVRGPRGTGLTRQEIIGEFERRLAAPINLEMSECLQQVDRIAELRLNDIFSLQCGDGDQIMSWADDLATISEDDGQLTVTFASPAHQASAQRLQTWMQQSGFDHVEIDAIGNVVARYFGHSATTDDLASRKTLLTGSHYDTVRNGGRYDGRLGILTPMAVVKRLARESVRLSFDLEVIGFCEEEGVRFGTTLLGSSALAGSFNQGDLDAVDAAGITMRQAMINAGLKPDAIAGLARDPARQLGFVEIHIEQGPVLLNADLALGVVTSINGAIRVLIEFHGYAGHAGTTPMTERCDAATAAAELVLFVESRCRAESDLVGTVGILEVANGSVNVIPERCQLSLDVRAPNDQQRDKALADIMQRAQAIAERRHVQFESREIYRANAVPADADLMAGWMQAVASTGLPVMKLASGAGHDAMKMAELCPQAMLFVRGGRQGVSHNPLETINNDDAQLSADAFHAYLLNLEESL